MVGKGGGGGTTSCFPQSSSLLRLQVAPTVPLKQSNFDAICLAATSTHCVFIIAYRRRSITFQAIKSILLLNYVVFESLTRTADGGGESSKGGNRPVGPRLFQSALNETLKPLPIIALSRFSRLTREIKQKNQINFRNASAWNEC